MNTFLKLSLPTQLSAGNLTALCHRKDITYRIYTCAQDAAAIESSTIFMDLSRLIDARVIVPSTISFDAPNRYEPFSACYKLGMQDAAHERAGCIFLCADQIWADGALSNVFKLGDAGKKAVMISGPRVQQETFVPAFTRLLSECDGSKIAIAPRDAVRLAMEHLHPWDRSLFWSSNNLGRPASFMYWSVGNEGFIMRCFHLHPVLVRPDAEFPEFSETIDGSDFVSRACPNLNDVHVIEDSDEAMYFSIAPAGQSAELIDLPKRNWRGIIIWALHNALSEHNLYYLKKNIRFHTQETSDQWSAVVKLSDGLVDRVYRKLDHPVKRACLKFLLGAYLPIAPIIRRLPIFHQLLKRLTGMQENGSSV